MAEPVQKKARQECSEELCSEKTSLLNPQAIRRAILNDVKEPLVFKGYLKGKWKCLEWEVKDWGRVLGDDNLMFRVGARVKEGDQLKSPQWETECMKVSMRYCDFLEWIKGQRTCLSQCGSQVNCSTHWAYFDYFYMKDLEHPELLLGALDWGTFGFTERGLIDSTLWIGSTGANTPCHIDTYGCNLVAQVMGKKRWVLFPKSQSEYLSPTRVPYEESSIYSEVGFPRPDTSSHPKLVLTTPHVVTLEAGDVLFVPNQWWHSVENIEFAVSVNTWIELPSDDEERVKEAIVMHQIGSLCQGIESVDLLSSAFNPNMMSVATMTSTDLLNLLVHKVFHNTNPKEKQESEKSEGAHIGIFDWTNEEWCCSHDITRVEKLLFEEYYGNVASGNCEEKKRDSEENAKKYCSTTDEIQFSHLKLLIDAFTDPRVIDQVKKNLDEKLHSPL